MTRKNAVGILLGVGHLNATALNFVAFGTSGRRRSGQVFTVFIIVLAASEASIASPSSSGLPELPQHHG
jgi:NADH-quinone oxidoreductase subunit K